MIGRIVYIIGYFLIFLGVSELVPVLFAYIFDEYELIIPFFISSILTVFIGAGLYYAFKDKQEKPSHHEVILFLGIIWFILPFFAAVPFMTTGVLVNMVDAYFEATSALTTTGSTVFGNLDLLPKTMIFWRAFLQWQGGILVFIIAVSIMPLSQIGAINLFKSALPHGEGDGLNDRIRYAFFPLIKIYLLLTVICFVFLYISGVDLFDALTTSMATLSSGGFMSHTAQEGNNFSLSSQMILIPFMILAATNLTFHWLAFSKGSFKKYSSDIEGKYFIKLGLFAAVVIFFSFYISHQLTGKSIFEAVISSLFISFSSLSTTGYYSAGVGTLPITVIICILGLLFIGGTAGSTSGGFKVFRIKILLRHANKEISRLAYPHSIVPVRWNNLNVTAKAMMQVWSFLFLFLSVYALVSIAYGMFGYDFRASIGLAASNLFSAGGMIQAISSDFIGYHSLSEGAKWFTSFVMIIGRLEIIAFLMFFIPSFWRN